MRACRGWRDQGQLAQASTSRRLAANWARAWGTMEGTGHQQFSKVPQVVYCVARTSNQILGWHKECEVAASTDFQSNNFRYI